MAVQCVIEGVAVGEGLGVWMEGDSSVLYGLPGWGCSLVRPLPRPCNPLRHATVHVVALQLVRTGQDGGRASSQGVLRLRCSTLHCHQPLCAWCPHLVGCQQLVAAE